MITVLPVRSDGWYCLTGPWYKKGWERLLQTTTIDLFYGTYMSNYLRIFLKMWTFGKFCHNDGQNIPKRTTQTKKKVYVAQSNVRCSTEECKQSGLLRIAACLTTYLSTLLGLVHSDEVYFLIIYCPNFFLYWRFVYSDGADSNVDPNVSPVWYLPLHGSDITEWYTAMGSDASVVHS